MKQQLQPVDKLFTVLQEIDLVALHPGCAAGSDEVLSATRASITGVLRDFLAAQELSHDRITVLDGFFFVFNEPKFSQWHRLDWWEQRRCIQAIKDSRQYTDRAHALL